MNFKNNDDEKHYEELWDDHYEKMFDAFVENYNVDTHFWSSLSLYNSNITEKIVEKYIDKSWHFDNLLYFKKISYEFIKNHNDIEWTQYYVDHIDPSVLERAFADPDSQEDWTDLCYHINFRPQHIRKIIEMNKDISYIKLSFITTWDIVEDYPDKPWDFLFLSMNKAVIKNFNENVLANKDKFPFVWDTLSQFVEWKFIEENMDLPWNWYCVSSNKSLTSDAVRKYPDKNWDLQCLLLVLDLDFITSKIVENPLLFVEHNNIYRICKNQHLTVDFINNNPQINWDMSLVSCNENIDFYDVITNPDKQWHLNLLAENPMRFAKKRFIENEKAREKREKRTKNKYDFVVTFTKFKKDPTKIKPSKKNEPNMNVYFPPELLRYVGGFI